MKKARASLHISVLVPCPSCDELLDLLNENDTSGVMVDDDGDVMKQVLPNNSFPAGNEKFDIRSVECSKCGAEFDVKGLDY